MFMNAKAVMQKRIILLAISAVTIIALVSGATMAWFTDSDSSSVSEFTASTLLIEADTLTFYGIGYEDSNIYEVLVGDDKVTLNKIFDTEKPNKLNSLAYDRKNRLLYYTHEKNNKSSLHYYNLDDGTYGIVADKINYDSNTEPHKLWGATFGMGYYWYINEGTDDLYRIRFKENGTKIDEIDLYDDNFTGDDNKAFSFGDISLEISEGIMYASTYSKDGIGQQFFTYDIRNRVYNRIEAADALNLQLALGSDGLLYGHETREHTWYTINKDTGKKVLLFEDTTNEIQLSDLGATVLIPIISI